VKVLNAIVLVCILVMLVVATSLIWRFERAYTDAPTPVTTEPFVPMSEQPSASGPCPLGYPTVSHFYCTTPTIPPEQWPSG